MVNVDVISYNVKSVRRVWARKNKKKGLLREKHFLIISYTLYNTMHYTYY